MAEYLLKYGRFLGNRPWLVVAVSVLMLIAANIGSSLIEESVTDFEDQIPSDIESLQAFQFVEDEFGETGANVIIAVEIDPEYPGSEEKRDIRAADVMVYMDVLVQKARTIELVTGATSAGDLLKASGDGRIPKSDSKIREIIDEGTVLPDTGSGSTLTFLVATDQQLEQLEAGLISQQELIENLSAAGLDESNLALLLQVQGIRFGLAQTLELIERFGIADETVIASLPTSNPYGFYLNEDFSVAVVRISFVTSDEIDSEQMVDMLQQIIDETDPPMGIRATLTGGPVTDIVLNRTIGPTFAMTGLFSFIGIFIVVILIFFSIRYGITSLLAVIFGSAWAFGFAGFVGMNLTPETSGALSLILGIGIDFGIQVVTRFRQELRKSDPRVAIATTMPNVIPPMTIATLAIVVGFQSLSFANLQFISALGDIMSIGVVMSYIAAITVVPAVLVILNTISLKSLAKRK